MKIRKAEISDAFAFVKIKDQLPLQMADGTCSKGGFLLGTTVATYAYYITSSICLVAEDEGRVVGFGIIFPDEVLRRSDVWIRRKTAKWNIELDAYEPQDLCYFEQFAFLKGYKRTAISLAYQITKLAFDSGYTTMFTTTVNKPVLNLAAIPFVQAAGGEKAGNINETYPAVGAINSDIYMLEAPVFYTMAAAHPLYNFVNSHTYAA